MVILDDTMHNTTPETGCEPALVEDTGLALVSDADSDAPKPLPTPPAHLLQKLEDALRRSYQFREDDDTTEGDSASVSGTDVSSACATDRRPASDVDNEQIHSGTATPCDSRSAGEPIVAAPSAVPVTSLSGPLRSNLRNRGSAVLAELGQGRCNGRRRVLEAPAAEAAMATAAAVAATAEIDLAPMKVAAIHVRGEETKVLEPELPVKKRPIFLDASAAQSQRNFDQSRPLLKKVPAFLLETTTPVWGNVVCAR